MTALLIAAFVFLAAAMAADVLTTRKAINAGAKEAHPLSRWLLDRMGIKGLWLAKVAALLVAFILCAWLGDVTALTYCCGLGAVHVGLAVWNWRVRERAHYRNRAY